MSAQTIIENEINSKEESTKRNTVIRVVHNRENPFVQLNKEALWDMKLSLKSVGLWARCMSRPDDWTFSVKEIINNCKEGRKAIDSALKELMEANYACKLEFVNKDKNNKFNDKVIEYVFFEFPATEEEKQKQLEIFKKSFRNCPFGNFRQGNFRKEHLLIQNTTKIESSSLERLEEKEIHPTLKEDVADAPRVSDPPTPKPVKKGKKKELSDAARELFPKFVKVIKDFKPTYVVKNEGNILESIDEMLKEGRNPDDILRVLAWAVRDNIKRGDWNGWSSKILCKNPAAYLCNKFDQMDTASMAVLDRKFAPSSDDNEALRMMEAADRRAVGGKYERH